MSATGPSGISDNGFHLTDFDVRSGLGRTLTFQTMWMCGVGVVLLLMPARRFTTPSWQFIEALPCGDDIIGGCYLLMGVAMAVSMLKRRQQWMSTALLAAGVMNWTLGLFLLVGALKGSAGGLGFPLAMYPGLHMLLTSVMLRRHT